MAEMLSDKHQSVQESNETGWRLRLFTIYPKNPEILDGSKWKESFCLPERKFSWESVISWKVEQHCKQNIWMENVHSIC